MVYFQRLAHVNDDNHALDKYKKAGKERKKYMVSWKICWSTVLETDNQNVFHENGFD